MIEAVLKAVLEGANRVALILGYLMMVIGGGFVTGFFVYKMADWLLRATSYPGAWMKIALELHRQKKFRWQKGGEGK
jgi:hypothetical protein